MSAIKNKNSSTGPRGYVVRAQRALEEAVYQLDRAFAVGTEIGTAADIETAFDLMPGEAGAFVNLVSTVRSHLSNAAVTNFINRFIP